MESILLQYFDELRGDRHFPGEDEIDQDALEDIWDYCFLMNINDIHHGDTGRFTYLGSGLVESHNEGLEEDELYQKLLGPDDSIIHEKIHEVLDNKEPITESSHFDSTQGLVVDYTLCIVPLGSDDSSVEYVLGVVEWEIR